MFCEDIKTDNFIIIKRNEEYIVRMIDFGGDYCNLNKLQDLFQKYGKKYNLNSREVFFIYIIYQLLLIIFKYYEIKSEFYVPFEKFLNDNNIKMMNELIKDPDLQITFLHYTKIDPFSNEFIERIETIKKLINEYYKKIENYQLSTIFGKLKYKSKKKKPIRVRSKSKSKLNNVRIKRKLTK